MKMLKNEESEEAVVPTRYYLCRVGIDGGLGCAEKVLIYYFSILLDILYPYFLFRDFFLDRFSFLDIFLSFP